MNIRSKALIWLNSHFGQVEGKIYTSKYYIPDESWPRKHVWWPQIPLRVVNEPGVNNINILCQVEPGKNEFHYLKVPVNYFQDNLDSFDVVQGMIHLYLSAEPGNLFAEIRGRGNLGFEQFLVL